jgi:hypothetical protein
MIGGEVIRPGMIFMRAKPILRIFTGTDRWRLGEFGAKMILPERFGTG